MSNFIYAFHGGHSSPDAGDGAAVAEKWRVWMEGLGSSIIHPGAPVGKSSTVTAPGTIEANGGSNPLSGFTIVEADSIDAAIAMANDCPILETGGTIEVAEMMAM
ncbi:MAG: YciI family protein [Pseudomonadota bacterium]